MPPDPASSPEGTVASRTLLNAVRSTAARFYPCDLHVHSLGSFDVCLPGRYEQLPEQLQALVPSLTTEPANLAAYDQKCATEPNITAFYNALLARRDEVIAEAGIPETDNSAIVGITDHNTAHFATALSAYAWERRRTDRLIVLPGIELEVLFPLEGVVDPCRVHLLALFAPCTTSSDIRLTINATRGNTTPTWDFGVPIEVPEFPVFVSSLRAHQQYPAICVAAHVWSKKGIENEPKKMFLNTVEAEIARLQGELQRVDDERATSDQQELTNRLTDLETKLKDDEGRHLDTLRLIGQCGFDALQVRDETQETHYRRLHRFRDAYGRAVPVTCSDAHSPTAIFSCVTGTPFVKLSAAPTTFDAKGLFRELRDRVLRFGETRTTYSKPNKVSQWIEGIEIIPDATDACNFWRPPNDSEAVTAERPFILPLSRNLNCFVGGRGSGKSAAIEAIALTTHHDEFLQTGRKVEKDQPDWYRRAVATIAGCKVRVVWKSTSASGIGSLPKRALFVSTYFDIDGAHGAIEVRDANGNAIVDDSIRLPTVNLFRAHQIESTANPSNLRSLFDELCGPDKEALDEQIAEYREQLAEQRGTIVSLCEEVAELAIDGSPLRQYGIRKLQFEQVDRPELRSKFEYVDAASAISVTAEQVREDWESFQLEQAIEQVESDVQDFLATAHSKLLDGTDESPSVHLGHKTLYKLLRNEDPAATSLSTSMLTNIQSAKESLYGFAAALRANETACDDILRNRKDDLAAEGLPTGSGEREAKQKAFEDAKSAFDKYRVKIAAIRDGLMERAKLHESLEEVCRQRTTLREVTAGKLTEQLARDLDGNVLRIEVDAQAMKDRAEFNKWLESNLDPCFRGYKEHRRSALLDSGVLPITLREELLKEDDCDGKIFIVDKRLVEEGKISETDAKLVVNNCRGRVRIPLDEAEQWSEEFQITLPDDLKSGIFTFPKKQNGQLAIDAVLQLDEIVLDDLPEVRLNDRPHESGTVAKPLSQLSPGQRCSAILPILLLTGDSPLVIDQPEENLDNRLIRQVIVNILGSMKLRRQVIVATHNPNLPVLGDAEQCVVLEATGRDQSKVAATGNLDSPSIAAYITDIMEGGREAFQYRQTIYQSHWNAPIEEAQ